MRRLPFTELLSPSAQSEAKCLNPAQYYSFFKLKKIKSCLGMMCASRYTRHSTHVEVKQALCPPSQLASPQHYSCPLPYLLHTIPWACLPARHPPGPCLPLLEAPLSSSGPTYCSGLQRPAGSSPFLIRPQGSPLAARSVFFYFLETKSVM